MSPYVVQMSNDPTPFFIIVFGSIGAIILTVVVVRKLLRLRRQRVEKGLMAKAVEVGMEPNRPKKSPVLFINGIANRKVEEVIYHHADNQKTDSWFFKVGSGDGVRIIRDTEELQCFQNNVRIGGQKARVVLNDTPPPGMVTRRKFHDFEGEVPANNPGTLTEIFLPAKAQLVAIGVFGNSLLLKETKGDDARFTLVFKAPDGTLHTFSKTAHVMSYDGII